MPPNNNNNNVDPKERKEVPTVHSNTNNNTNQQQQQLLLVSSLEEYERERTRQRIILEELGRQKMDIIQRMNTISQSLEVLDNTIEQIEQQQLVLLSSTSTSTSSVIKIKTEQQQQPIIPSMVIKSEKGIKNEPQPEQKQQQDDDDDDENNIRKSSLNNTIITDTDTTTLTDATATTTTTAIIMSTKSALTASTTTSTTTSTSTNPILQKQLLVSNKQVRRTRTMQTARKVHETKNQSIEQQHQQQQNEGVKMNHDNPIHSNSNSTHHHHQHIPTQFDNNDDNNDEILTDPHMTLTMLSPSNRNNGTKQLQHQPITGGGGGGGFHTNEDNNNNNNHCNENDDDDFQLYDDDDDDDDSVENDNEYYDGNQQQLQLQQLSLLEQEYATTTTAATANNNQNNNNSHHSNHYNTNPMMHHINNNSNNITIHQPHLSEQSSTRTTTATTNYPWTTQLLDLLHNKFHINHFREQQEDIINATMMGKDVFVIMRTGGGKSLTYQLPALYEGRYNNNNTKKITLVISPLLSLIQDQEEQMNQFAPGSAISFTSSIGASEHTKRWEMVRNPNSGVCIIFCTPEKVSKSNRLCSELDKLHIQNRLGRFVIDEAHCACQWGHDFRPDYVKLGKLKMHFPSIPIIAVTATASDRVRNEVCEILQLRNNYQFFRSTFARPNLIYSIVPKPDNKNTVIEMMAEFIKTKYPNDAGIVYTYSKKDADTVADALCNYGVIAEPYHSDVSTTIKEAVHKSWMRNETQVVVATIAFGLGINKPDVRFVLHHSISKTLEAYYQESGRAGRDGNQSECVLYYNPKDVIKMLKMVHGTSSEHLVWPMVRYAQESGNDAVCKSILLTHLGEPNVRDVRAVVSENEDIVTTKRDVGKHAKTVVQLLQLRLEQDLNVTMSMLVKDWRSTGASAEQCVKDNPPGKDGLSADDCERIVTSLLLERVIATNPIWNAYDTIIYLALGEFGPNMLTSANPKCVIRLPKREGKKMTTQSTTASKQSTVRKTITKDANEWLATKSKSSKRKKATSAKAKPAKKVKVKTTKKVGKQDTTLNTKKPKTVRKTVNSTDVIELSSDDDTEPDIPLASLKRSSAAATTEENEVLWDDDDDVENEYSEEEYEYEE